MDSPQINKSWNKYETVLLIDAYEKVASGTVRRIDAVSQLSKRLRDGMTAMGVSISDTFRNENGISIQMTVIKDLLNEAESSFGSPNHTFVDMCSLYLNDKIAYERLLGTAERMFPLSYTVSIKPSANWQEESENVVSSPDFPVSLRKSIMVEVFKKKFRNGMRLSSAIDRRKFRNTYQELSGVSLGNVSDEALISQIKNSAILFDNVAYLPELMLADCLKRKIVGYVQDSFLSGEQCVFFEIILNKFHHELLDSQILNVDMLRGYLEHINSFGWLFYHDYISTQEQAKPDIERVVLEYIKEAGGIVTEEEITDAFPQFPVDSVLQAYRFNADTLINCGRGRGKIHIDNFHITGEEIARISSILNKEFAKNGYMLWPELAQYIKDIIPNVFDYNEQFSDIGIRKALSVKLGDPYYFNKSVISTYWSSVDAKSVMANFARTHELYTIANVKQLGEYLNTNINPYIGELLEYSVRVDGKNFVSKKSVKFNVEETDRVIDGYCTGNYLPINSISNYSLFPSCGHPWNEFLLESYVFDFSKHFQLMHNNFGMSNAIGAIVRRNTTLTYDDVMADALAKSGNLSQQEAIEYLYDEGYIGQRRLSNVSELIKKARSIRRKQRSN